MTNTFTVESAWLQQARLPELMREAAALRDATFGRVITHSRKVFIPLTRLCRDVCHYCTFARTPRRLDAPYLMPDEVIAIAVEGRSHGCREALFTLGDQPERRYRVAREALRALGFDSTVAYLQAMAQRVLGETGLLPHLNPGILSREDFHRLREVAPSMGLMLESSATRLCQPGGPHYGSPDKDPAVRLACIQAAGEARVPLTSGILIGIGETREERLQSLQALAACHAEFGHIQEVIIQNFVPKPGTKMQAIAPPPFEELLWTVAVARLTLPAEISVQVPPNLNAGRLGELIDAGINDWGGVSPVTPDHINPESPWPQLAGLARETRDAGSVLVQRLTIYPRYVRTAEDWIAPRLRGHVLRHADSDGFAREDDWCVGLNREPPQPAPRPRLESRPNALQGLLHKAQDGRELEPTEIATLFRARGESEWCIEQAADQLRRATSGEEVTYVVNRNINYTNVCLYKCAFCAFSKGRTSIDLRGPAYVVDLDEIRRRAQEAWDRGATEVCMQGGIHPAFTGETYLKICQAVKDTVPEMHVHAFSPLEVTQGARTLGLSVEEFLRRLKLAGLGSLPGTAAEILDDRVRARICPDKVNTRDWLAVVEAAHHLNLPTTSTIMFGHLEGVESWATHLLALRRLQQRTGGITEFVPLPFVHMEAPLYRRGAARPGPTLREVLLMHAVARLALHPLITNIQVSWPKLGPTVAARVLRAGANDLGGTLMNESISRAAGAAHGQELAPQQMQSLIHSIGRGPRQRTTLYGKVSAERQDIAWSPSALRTPINRPAREYGLE
jgi:FO synthase